MMRILKSCRESHLGLLNAEDSELEDTYKMKRRLSKEPAENRGSHWTSSEYLTQNSNIMWYFEIRNAKPD